MKPKERTPLEKQLFDLRISQNDVARIAGVSQSYISHVTRGEKKASPKVVAAFRTLGIELASNHKSGAEER